LKIKLTGFQMLLLVCWFEVKTGIMISLFYWLISLYFLFLARMGWYIILDSYRKE